MSVMPEKHQQSVVTDVSHCDSLMAHLDPVFQLDFEIFTTIDSFIQIFSGHSLIIKLG